ncbi:uncharacterized protein [Nicotiana tomentosiformis]|uniref:uncharacterized protein n=1 Tax=Nicotiana tomentosiformis TaxID=4098 RepID=UPI00051B70B7
MGFGERWIRLIKFSLTTVKYSLFINRSPIGFFSPQKGIRQGDPLSPFLFIIAMEGLSKMLDKARQLEWIEGFRINNNSWNSISVSHLLYADGTLIFCGAEKLQLQHNELMSCDIGSFPTTYLGLPLGAKHKSVEAWNAVIEKVEKRLATWQMQYLSMGGRVTLINSVLDNIPI